MSSIHVCSLAKVPETVRSTGAKRLVTLINQDTPFKRPKQIARDRHLFVGISDITGPADGHILPAPNHVEALLTFVSLWDLKHPIVIHCFAGVSRSTAAAFITACALNPKLSELEIAQAIRRYSPTATPNSRLVALADEKLGREGRMIAAIASIGKGQECYEGIPFSLRLG